MAIVNGYCTEAQVRAQIADQASVVPLAMIEDAINASSRAIDSYCGWPMRRFWKDTVATARTYRVDDPLVAWVQDFYSLADLVVQTDDASDGSFSTTWSASDYQAEPLNSDDGVTPFAWYRITAVGGRAFPVHQARAMLKVTTKHGWSAIPDGVESACILKSVSLLKRKEAPFGVAGFGAFGAVRIGSADPDVRELLAPFRRSHLRAVS